MRLSEYVESPLVKEGSNWVHPQTGESVALGPYIRDLLPDILQIDLDKCYDTAEHNFLQLLAYELSSKGFLIPDTVKDEDEYLNRTCPLKERPTFFFGKSAKLSGIPDEPTIGLFGVPTDLGAYHKGTSRGPEMLRQASRNISFRSGNRSGCLDLGSRQKVLETLNFYDLGDLDFQRQNLDYWLKALEEVVEQIPAQVIPFMIGGDHTLSLSTIRGLYHKRKTPFRVIQLDQHLDLQTWGTYRSGQPYKLDKPLHANFMSHVHALDPGMEIIQIGPSHYQAFTSEIYEDLTRYLERVGRQLSDIDTNAASSEQLLDFIGTGQDVYLTIDVDVLSRRELLSTGYPADIGISFARLLEIVSMTIKHNTIIGIDIMELGTPDGLSPQQAISDAQKIAILLLRIIQDLSQKLC
jgi:arginase family enzyme